MTNEEKVKAYAMRLDGATLQEVADALGVSREYIRQITPPVETHGRRRSSYDGCIFPNIANWLYDNRYSYNRFAKLVASNSMSVYRALVGQTDMPKKLIDKILDATGMTYEEAFAKDNREFSDETTRDCSRQKRAAPGGRNTGDGNKEK